MTQQFKKNKKNKLKALLKMKIFKPQKNLSTLSIVKFTVYCEMFIFVVKHVKTSFNFVFGNDLKRFLN